VEAEEAIRLLSQSGFDVKKLSLVGKGYHSEEHPIGFYSTGDRIKVWLALPGRLARRAAMACS
jgi:hypothetical protein